MSTHDPIVTISRPEGSKEQGISIAFATREGHLLYPREDSKVSLLATLMKQQEDDKPLPSNQSAAIGRKSHPFDFDAARKFKINNVHHSTCVQATKMSLVGLGFDAEKVAEILDPLCENSWNDSLQDAAEDFIDTGNGYLEVTRNGDKIAGLHHLPTNDVDIYIEDATYNKHFRIRSRTGSGGGLVDGRIFAKFGDKANLITRLNSGKSSGDAINEKTVSEVIHFRQSTSMSRWYGFPRWLAATASIELMQALHQFSFDFFINRGVPEFILFITGGKVDKADWVKIENAMKQNIGLGNSHKSMALNLDQPGMMVQVEKLAMDGTGDSTMLRDMSETLALSIVSAHGVPPLLAGIQIPGKLGATNELPNALQAFQALVVGPMQNVFTTTLGVTLGNEKFNGGLGLKKTDFALKKILDAVDLGQMDTVARMRQTVPEAKAQGRDLSAGLKKSLEMYGPEKVLGMILSDTLMRMNDAA